MWANQSSLLAGQVKNTKKLIKTRKGEYSRLPDNGQQANHAVGPPRRGRSGTVPGSPLVWCSLPPTSLPVLGATTRAAPRAQPAARGSRPVAAQQLLNSCPLLK